MLDGRFGHFVIEFGKHIYVIGGNTYGAEPESCLKSCERFEPAKKKKKEFWT